jgi:hypothetical protein
VLWFDLGGGAACPSLVARDSHAWVQLYVIRGKWRRFTCIADIRETSPPL